MPGMRTSLAVRLAAALLPAFFLAACGGETEPTKAPVPQETPGAGAATPPAMIEAIATPEVHHAVCGHTLDEVGHCGNYVELGGKHVELIWAELGKMEFCKDKAKGAEIEIAGEMKDGKFVATSYRRVE